VKTPEKGTAIPKSSTKTATQGLRIRPEELPEITHNCWCEWDEILMTLKEYFRKHFQDLESICLEPLSGSSGPDIWTLSLESVFGILLKCHKNFVPLAPAIVGYLW
jgi:hypothetical protein